MVAQQSLEDKLNLFSVQSADVELTSTTEMVAEQVGFTENAQDDTAGMRGEIDEVAEDIYTGYTELSSYLQRPVKIATYTIPLGETMNFRSILPWNLFLKNTAINKKLDFYAYIQGNLHIKAVINSTPFVYGEYAISYRPHVNFGAQFNVLDLTNTVERVATTQRPTIYLESHKNKGGEMTLPFFWYKNWLELTDVDTQNMGQLLLYPMAPFRSANGAALTPPTVTIYAWMTETKLAGNTARLAVQSRDEYGTGPVSSVASAVAGVSRRLEDVPVIGKFAKATTFGARAISSIASLFGFTNVPVIDNVAPVKDTPFHGFASSEIGVPLEKLTLDPKCELSIDPTVCGAPSSDELVIDNFVKREAWIAEADWAQTDAVDVQLIEANVTPTHCRTFKSGVEMRYLDTPSALASRLFSNWRGDIVYRVKIVKSQYHQGRLLFTFDPTGTALLSASPETVVNSQIVDVSTTDEVVVRIPYMAPQSFLRVPPVVGRDIGWKGVAAPAYDHDYHNGRFRVSVLNPLTGPDTTSQVRILVFVHAEELELANPSDVAFSSSLFQVQSSDSTVRFTLGQETPSPDQVYAVNFGEDVRSLRSVMRRTTYLAADVRTSSTTPLAGGTYTFNGANFYNIYPPYYGFDPNGRNTAPKQLGAGSAPANYSCDPPSNVITPCFVGVRGSYNYSVNEMTQGEHNLSAVRWNEPIPSFGSSTFSTATTQGRFVKERGLAGMSVTDDRTQAGLQFSIPFMNKFKFMDTSPNTKVSGKAEDDSENNNVMISTRATLVAQSAVPLQSGSVQARYGAIGVDYTPIMFVNVPWRHLYTLTE